MLERAFYSATINDFFSESTNSILAKIVRNNPYDLNDLQRDAWIKEIDILKKNLWGINIGRVILEYNIPRMGKRIDCILLCKGIVFILEFKVGATVYRKSTDDQVMDYALDLKNFQKSCQDKIIIPISISTEAPPSKCHVLLYEDGVAKPVRTNADGLASVINEVSVKYQRNDFDYHEWEHSDYMPTPTIVEAAQALYNNHNVHEITRADAGAKNLTETISAIKEIIQKSKAKHEKSIIFVTGVPGAG